jgi:hypothetical protein
MPCTGRYAQAADYENLFCAGVDLGNAGEVNTVNTYLDLAASDIHVALAAAGACNCTLESWAAEYLKKLNIIDAAVIKGCPCGRIDNERKQVLGEWLERQYELIRTGRVPLCAGDTGADFPAFGVAEFGYTVWNEAQIIDNARRRRP